MKVSPVTQVPLLLATFCLMLFKTHSRYQMSSSPSSLSPANDLHDSSNNLDCVAESSKPVVYHPNQIYNKYELLRPPPRRPPPHRVSVTLASSAHHANAAAARPAQHEAAVAAAAARAAVAKFPALFAEGREGALLPLVPVDRMADLLRQTCQQWNLVHDRIVCAQWKLSMVAVPPRASAASARSGGAEVAAGPALGAKPAAAGLAKPWPPVFFSNA